MLRGGEFRGSSSMLPSSGRDECLDLDVCCCGGDEDRGLEAGGFEGLYNYGRAPAEGEVHRADGVVRTVEHPLQRTAARPIPSRPPAVVGVRP